MQIALFVSSNDALKPGWLLKDIRPAHIKEMQQNLAKVCNQGCTEFYFTPPPYLALSYDYFLVNSETSYYYLPMSS
jgi:hypothetical protein